MYKSFLFFFCFVFFSGFVFAFEGSSVSSILDSGLLNEEVAAVDGNSTSIFGLVSSPVLSYVDANSFSYTALVGMVFLSQFVPPVQPPLGSVDVNSLRDLLFFPIVLNAKSGFSLVPGSRVPLQDLRLVLGGSNILNLSVGFECFDSNFCAASFCSVVSQSSFFLNPSVPLTVFSECSIPVGAKVGQSYRAKLVIRSNSNGDRKEIPVSIVLKPVFSSPLGGFPVLVSEVKGSLAGFFDYGIVCFGLEHNDCLVRFGIVPLQVGPFRVLYVSILDVLIVIFLVLAILNFFRIECSVLVVFLLLLKLLVLYGFT